MRVTVLAIIGILVVGISFNFVLAIELKPHQEPLEIKTISHTPFSPIVNSTVNFTATLSAPSTIDLTNVTLILDIEGMEVRILMKNEDTNVFKSEVVMNKTGKVTYYAELFINNNLADTSSINSFHVITNQFSIVPVEIEYGKKSGLPIGNYSIGSPQDEINISIMLEKSLSITISKENSGKFPSVTNTIALSQKYRIEVNDTTAFTQAQLSLKYNSSLVEQMEIDPKLLQIYTRESSNDQWQVVHSTLILEENRIVTVTNTFSEWVVAASTPKLRFLDVVENRSGNLDENLNLQVKVKNFGALPAENVSVRIILPSSILVNNISTVVYYPSLSPLANISINWDLIFQETGEYNILLATESSNSDGDILQIKITISDNNASVSSSVKESSFLIPIWGITVISFVLLARRKKII